MSVLTLAGKPIDWAKPPKATDRVMWSRRTTYGKAITGSLRSIAHLDHLNELAKMKFGTDIVVFQGPYNTGVKASAGTHDYDACSDMYIPSVSWAEQNEFFRSNGHGGWVRTPPAFSYHWHGFTLPPREGRDVSDDFRSAGFTVGKYVDGGWSLYGRAGHSSQIADYYGHRTGLSGHAADRSWYPSNIEGTIFNLNTYIEARKPKPLTATFKVATNNVMSNPRNPRIRETLAATSGSSVLLLQEVDIFHNEVRNIPGYRCIPLPNGDIYNATIAYKPSVWEYVSHTYKKQYDGKKDISKTRHVARATLRHKKLGENFVFVSYHDVTRGQDSLRVRLRANARRVVRKILNNQRALKLPIVLGADVNQKAIVYRQANKITRQGIDHQYAWSSPTVKLSVISKRRTKTRSDHDALVVQYQAKVTK